MGNTTPGAWRLVLVPAFLSLVVTVLRLVGELAGWDDSWFSNVAPGGEHKPGFMGIAWLIPIFGFWFGFKLRRLTGEPANTGKAALRLLLGAVILIGGFLGCQAAGLISLPTAETPGEATGLGYALALVAISAVVMFTAWPRLGRTLILYALLARIPVIAVTWLALENGWDSHYTKLPVGSRLPAGVDPFVILAIPQLTFWVAATLLVGGLTGCLGAAVTRAAKG